MKVTHLLFELDALGDGKPTTAILIATRTVTGRRLPEGQVQLAAVGALRIDDDERTVDLVPTDFAGANTVALDGAALSARLAARADLGDYTLNGVDRRLELPNGGEVLKTQPLLGVLRLGDPPALWLLLQPEDQWPEDWFDD
ncbi:MAG: hypothetical protein AB7N70_22715 [Dehalococcoidia bacterium]